MNPLASTFLGLSLLLTLPSCSSTQEPKPEPIQNTGDESSNDADVVTHEPSDSDTRETTTGNIDTARIRLPNMEDLPSDKELSTSAPRPAESGGVIARPPSNP